MKEMPLTKGLVTQVDDEDYDDLNQHKWHVNKGRKGYYARRFEIVNKKRIVIKMSNVIMH